MHLVDMALGVAGRAAVAAALLVGVVACESKGDDRAPSSPGNDAKGGTKGAECDALKAAQKTADTKATLLMVPGVTSYGDLAEMANDVAAASKMIAAVKLTSRDLQGIRDKRKKQFDDFVAAARAQKGPPKERIPKDPATKLDAMASAVNTGGLDTFADVLKACP